LREKQNKCTTFLLEIGSHTSAQGAGEGGKEKARKRGQEAAGGGPCSSGPPRHKCASRRPGARSPWPPPPRRPQEQRSAREPWGAELPCRRRRRRACRPGFPPEVRPGVSPLGTRRQACRPGFRPACPRSRAGRRRHRAIRRSRCVPGNLRWLVVAAATSRERTRRSGGEPPPPAKGGAHRHASPAHARTKVASWRCPGAHSESKEIERAGGIEGRKEERKRMESERRASSRSLLMFTHCTRLPCSRLHSQGLPRSFSAGFI